jgi:hypothetical protein
MRRHIDFFNVNYGDMLRFVGVIAQNVLVNALVLFSGKRITALRRWSCWMKRSSMACDFV